MYQDLPMSDFIPTVERKVKYFVPYPTGEDKVQYEEYLSREGITVNDFLPILVSIKGMSDYSQVYDAITNLAFLMDYSEFGAFTLVGPSYGTSSDPEDKRYKELLLQLCETSDIQTIFSIFSELLILRIRIDNNAYSELLYC